jgi:hypothetical protein
LQLPNLQSGFSDPDTNITAEDITAMLGRPLHRVSVYRRARDAHHTRSGYVEKKIKLRRRRERGSETSRRSMTAVAVGSGSPND